jgi:hypothetical protein
MLQLKLFYKILNKGELDEFLYLEQKRAPLTSQPPLKEKLKIL